MALGAELLHQTAGSVVDQQSVGEDVVAAGEGLHHLVADAQLVIERGGVHQDGVLVGSGGRDVVVLFARHHRCRTNHYQCGECFK